MALFIVNSAADTVDPLDDVTTLREAILAANESPGEHRIRFDRSLEDQTIELTNDLPEIVQSLDIQGRDGLVIEANDYRVFDFNTDDGALRVAKLSISGADEAVSVHGTGNRVDIEKLDVTDSEEAMSINGARHTVNINRSDIVGTTGGADGAIDINADESTVSLYRTEIDGAGVSSSEAIEIDGDLVTLNVNRSIIENSGIGGNEGAVDSDEAEDLSLIINNSIFRSNGDTGLTIDSDRANVTITDTLFEDQDVGLEIDANGVSLNIYRSEFVRNGDGILVDGNNGPAQDLSAFVHGSEFIDNSGDGIDNNGEASSFTVRRTEFSGNGDRDLEGPDGFNVIGGIFPDELGGSEGDDVFTGGGGTDIFEFRTDKNGEIFGDDLITDFSGDRLRIQIDNLESDDLVIAERDLDLLTIFVDEDGDLGTDDRIFQGNIQFASESVVENLSEDDFASDSDLDIFI